MNKSSLTTALLLSSASFWVQANVPSVNVDGVASKSKSYNRPNIILIIADQLTSKAAGYTGNPYLNTPGIDRLAERGVVFQNAYCTAPLSGPSRTAMFTGRYPDEIGMIRNGSLLCDSLKNKTLGTLISESGYDCAYAGKWHVSESEIPDGVYGFRNIHGHNDFGLAEAAVNFIRQKHSKPFFLVASFDNPHNICEYARNQNLPWGNIKEPRLKDCPPLPDNFKRNVDDSDVILMEKQANYSAYPTIRYTKQDWRKYIYTYYRLVEKIDVEIQKIVLELERQNLQENTVVIFTSDHGDGLASHNWNQKSALYEEVVNIPLIVCLPGCENAGSKSSAIVSNGIDIFASICDIAGVKPYKGTKGISFISAAKNNSKPRKYAICETTFDNGKTRGWMLRTEKYKYVLYDKGKNREQLFNIFSDRGERKNLATDKRYSIILQNHRDILYNWMVENNVKSTRPIIHDIPGRTLDSTR